MTNAGQFDEQSAVRIGRTVLAHERGLPVPTKRRRRPPQASSERIIVVRLLTDVPAAALANQERASDFYQAWSDELAGRNWSELSNAEIQNFATAYEEPETVFGAGLALRCELDIDQDGLIRELGGWSHNVTITYGQVIKVWNMHLTSFSPDEDGGVFGSEAGSLGGGFCDAMRGPGGSYWLVGPDRRLVARAVDDLDILSGAISNLSQSIADLDDRITALGG